VPMPLDRHPDYAARGGFAMLAGLGDSPPTGGPELLAYLVHGGPGWPAHHGGGCGAMPRPPGCSEVYPWLSFPLDAETQALEAALIREYRSQLGQGPDLLRFATANELLTSGVVVRANRAMSRARAGVHRTATRIGIDIRRTACALDAEPAALCCRSSSACPPPSWRASPPTRGNTCTTTTAADTRPMRAPTWPSAWRARAGATSSSTRIRVAWCRTAIIHPGWACSSRAGSSPWGTTGPEPRGRSPRASIC